MMNTEQRVIVFVFFCATCGVIASVYTKDGVAGVLWLIGLILSLAIL